MILFFGGVQGGYSMIFQPRIHTQHFTCRNIHATTLKHIRENIHKGVQREKWSSNKSQRSSLTLNVFTVAPNQPGLHGNSVSDRHFLHSLVTTIHFSKAPGCQDVATGHQHAGMAEAFDARLAWRDARRNHSACYWGRLRGHSLCSHTEQKGSTQQRYYTPR